MNSSIVSPSDDATAHALPGKKSFKPAKAVRTSFIMILLLLAFQNISKAGPDKTPPDLKVSGPDTTTIEVTSKPLSPVPVPSVISAMDAVDGDLKTSVVIDANKVQTNILGLYIITYSVSDLSGNVATVYRYMNVIDTIAPVLKLVGANPIYIQVYHGYQEYGVTTSDNYYKSSVLNPLVKLTGTVDTSKLGTYTVTYDLTDPSGNKAKQVTRTVIVGDTVGPVLTIRGPQVDSMAVFTSYSDPGVSVFDNYDPNVTITISGTFKAAFPTGYANKLGVYTIIYTATDKSGNKSTVTRNIKVQDRIAPVLTLKGPSTVSVCQGFNYADAGYTVTDNYDKPTDIVVTMYSNVNTSTPGLYTVRYKGADKSNNIGYSSYRYVLVKSSTDFTCQNSVNSNIDTTICKGSCPYFNAPMSGSAYKWSTGQTTKTVQYCPKKDTFLSVAITQGSKTYTYQYNITVTKTTCVWPGDADDDMKDDKNDLLAIGIAYGDSGAMRTDQSIKWYGHPCDDWKKNFKGGANHKHADCNGDGTVDSTDMKAITKNYGSTHTKTSAMNGSPSDPPLSITFSSDSAHAGDTVSAVITLGTSSNAVKNAYGLAFSIEYTSRYVKPNRSVADLSKCWLGTPGKDLIYFLYDDTAKGVLDIAMTRIDHKNVSGYGELAKLSIVMQDDVGGKRWIDRKVYFTATDVNLISNDESTISVYSHTDSVKVFQSGINNGNLLPENSMMLFPNPVSNTLYLYSQVPDISLVKITGFDGKEIYRVADLKSTKIEIPVSSLAPGIYDITIITKDGSLVKRFVKN